MESTRIHRVVTDNGACYRSADFARIVGTKSRHQRTKPFTPRHTTGRPVKTWLGAASARSDPGQGVTTVSCVRYVGRVWCSVMARTGQTELT